MKLLAVGMAVSSHSSLNLQESYESDFFFFLNQTLTSLQNLPFNGIPFLMRYEINSLQLDCELSLPFLFLHSPFHFFFLWPVKKISLKRNFQRCGWRFRPYHFFFYQGVRIISQVQRLFSKLTFIEVGKGCVGLEANFHSHHINRKRSVSSHVDGRIKEILIGEKII